MTTDRMAVLITGHPNGLRGDGNPYIHPVKGMRVLLDSKEHGTILSLRHTQHGLDPEATIQTDSGRVVYLFQTAVFGYSPVASNPTP